MARSTAYWTANFYADPDCPPRPGAPLRDLPPDAAARFRAIRDGIRGIDRVTEKVRFIPPTWKWTWEYTFLGRKLCWLHVMETGVGGTFTISDEDERNLPGVARLAAVIELAIKNSQRTGPVRWCWIEFSDRRSVEAFLSFMKRKASWVAAQPLDSRIFRRSRAG